MKWSLAFVCERSKFVCWCIWKTAPIFSICDCNCKIFSLICYKIIVSDKLNPDISGIFHPRSSEVIHVKLMTFNSIKAFINGEGDVATLFPFVITENYHVISHIFIAFMIACLKYKHFFSKFLDNHKLWNLGYANIQV